MADSKHFVDDAGYGVGALASASFATVPGLLLLFYLTDTLAISAGLAGFIVFLPKLFDVFVNPVVGRLSDKTRTRFGARRPWMIVGGILFPLAFIATFWTPYSGNTAGVWVAVSFALASLTFSLFVVPWSSLPAEIAPDTNARTSMAAWRIAFLSIAILLSGGLAPLIVEDAADARSGYKVMALTLGCMMMVATLLVTFFGARRSQPGTTLPAPAGGFRASVGVLKSSQALRAMFWLVALTEIAAAVSLASTPYLAKYVLGDSGAVASMFIFLTVPLLITMPVWRSIAVGRGKRPMLRTALLIYAVGSLSLVALTAFPVDSRQWLAFASVFVVGVGFAGTSMLPQAMFADALAYEASTSGVSNTGSMVGAWNAVETISGGLGAATFALVLAMTGFISTGNDSIARQPQAAILGIVLGASLIPALAAFLAQYPLREFNLSEAKVDLATQGAN
ncbi:MFS transporter [Parasphingorhabdus litoris]|nr:MFS transporter [Parasphingorhabdus litoris]